MTTHLSRALALAAASLVAATSFGQAPTEVSPKSYTPKAARSTRGLLVRFKPSAPVAARANVRAAVGVRQLRKFGLVPGLELVEAPKGDVAAHVRALRNNPNVLYVEPDYVLKPTGDPNDPSYANLWGLKNSNNFDIDAPEAWDLTTGNPDTIIAVLDTGVAIDHPDLQGNLWKNAGEIAGNGIDDDQNGYVDDVNGWDFFDGDNDPSDTHGHGTHVAGTIGAVGDNGIGVTGVNWSCKIMPLRFLGPDGGYTSDAILALEYAVKMGAKVSNHSYGGDGYTQAMFDAIQNAGTANHMVVAAAGNANVDTDVTPHYPSGYVLSNVLSVGALDRNGNRASFSNYGYYTVDLFAPGVGILSTVPGGGYASFNGTSMASPHVAGVVGLLYGRNPSLTIDQARHAIRASARPLASLTNLCATNGLLNIPVAIEYANTSPSLTISAPTSGATVNQGTPVTFSGSANDFEDGGLNAGMLWTSNLQGRLGIGASFSRSDLVLGTHKVTITVRDSQGFLTTKDVFVTVKSADTTVTAPAAPSSLRVVNSAAGVATIQWGDASNNEAGFEVQRERWNGTAWFETVTTEAAANATSSTASGLVRGTYRWRVRAFNSGGTSAWRGWVTQSIR